MAWEFYRYSQKFEMHMSHIDKEDFKQIADIAIFEAYNRYNHEFTKDEYEKYDEKNCIGFYPFLEKTIKGEMLKFIRNSLKTRRKNYNMHEIAVTSSDMPLSNQKGDSEIFLKDIIEDENSSNDFKTLELKLEIEEYMKYLTDIEKNIIHNRFYENLTQKQISEKYNMSQGHASRIIKKAIEKMKFASTIKRKYVKINKTHKTTMEVSTMKKETINTSHALEYFKAHIKDERPLDDIMDKYCNILNISKSELVYALHTTCSKEYNSIVDLYMKYEKDDLHEEFENVSSIRNGRTKAKKYKETTKTIKKKEEIKEVKEIKEELQENNDIFNGLKILDMSIEFDLFKAIISKQSVMLTDLPDDVDLSIEEITALRDDLTKLIELKKGLSAITLK